MNYRLWKRKPARLKPLPEQRTQKAAMQAAITELWTDDTWEVFIDEVITKKRWICRLNGDTGELTITVFNEERYGETAAKTTETTV